MRRSRALPPWPVIVVLAGCAAISGRGEPDPADEVERGLAALAREDFRAATALLDPVVLRHGGEPVGRQAQLALAAAALDPRNPDRRLDAGAALSASYLLRADAPEWTRPVARSLYLLALEVGAAAPDERVKGMAEEPGEAAAPPMLPRLPGRPLSEVVRGLERERTRLREEQEKLAQERAQLARRVGELEQRLAERERELERIRKILRQ